MRFLSARARCRFAWVYSVAIASCRLTTDSSNSCASVSSNFGGARGAIMCGRSGATRRRWWCRKERQTRRWHVMLLTVPL
ncbi:hypothetical protein C8R44DRAFT_94717 [Mycena epipterygia]|nr:hypothetical protein C8R44DRAFT_94717 [Mycena epipterygia]